MSAHTVGLLAHTGRIGLPLFKQLLQAHDQGKIVLVVLHRPGSNVSRIPEYIEKRVVDITKPNQSEIQAAVQGLNVLVSAVSFKAAQSQHHLVKALSETKGFVTFIPSGFGPSWLNTAYPAKDERMKGFTHSFEGLQKEVEKYKLGVTVLECGIFDEFFFDYAMFGTDVQKNSIQLYEGAMDKPAYLSTPQSIAKALANLAVHPPSAIVNKTYHTYDLLPTGSQLVQELTSLHGSPTKVVPFTEEEYDKIMSKGSWGCHGAMFKKSWGTGEWDWHGERVDVGVMSEEEIRSEIRRWKTEGMGVWSRNWAYAKMMLGMLF